MAERGARFFAYGWVLLVLAACAPETPVTDPAATQREAEGEVKGGPAHLQHVTQITQTQLETAHNQSADWLSYGRDYREDRYSPLTQINKQTVSELGLAWSLDLGTKRGIQATPIVVDGIMFVTGPWSVVWAINTRDGQILWKFDPEVPRDVAGRLCCGVVNRGVAIYQGDVFVGTLDGRLISLNAATGKPNWSVQTVPIGEFYSITGAPRIVKGRVLIGNGGAEFKARGYVTAYDAKSGEQDWRFYTVPGNPKDEFEHPDLAQAVQTWNGEWWRQGGGGTVWDAINYDPELNLVYIGVGNGSHWNREIRSPGGGDNLYLSSIVALDADSGAYRWHFQTTPGDSWDYTATQPIILADIEINGVLRKVLMQAPKNGYFYVLDRVTGEFISGDNYVYQNWTTGLDAKGRPIEAPGARYLSGQSHWLTPGPLGGHNWFPMAFNRDTGLVYIPTGRQSMAYTYNPAMGYASHEAIAGRIGGNISLESKLYNQPVFDPKAPPPGQRSGRLVAYDPVRHEEVWGVDQPFFYNGGVLTTAAGLVMQGDAEGMFTIRDAATGEALWQADVRSGVLAPPVTYAVDGEQYISLAVGWGGSQGMLAKAVPTLAPGTIYTWKLGGDATAPTRPSHSVKPITTLASDADPLTVGRGVSSFVNLCSGCHELGMGGGAVPDLIRSNDGVFAIYDQILQQGLLAEQGMPNFADVLRPGEVDAIKAYVLYHAKRVREGADMLTLMTELAGLQYQADAAAQSSDASQSNQ